MQMYIDTKKDVSIKETKVSHIIISDTFSCKTTVILLFLSHITHL